MQASFKMLPRRAPPGSRRFRRSVKRLGGAVQMDVLVDTRIEFRKTRRSVFESVYLPRMEPE